MTCQAVFMGLLGLLVFLGAGCGKREPKPVDVAALEKPAVEEQAPLPATQKLTRKSPVDGLTLTATVTLPDGYDNSHLRPLVVVLPGTPFPETLSAGQALVARLENVRPASCPSWLLQADALNMMEYLVANCAVEPRKVFLVASGVTGLEFACRQAARLAGVYLSFPGDETAYDHTLPLRNLLNIPVYLDKTQGKMPAAALLEVEKYLQNAGATRLMAPDYLLGERTADASVNQAFLWLGSQTEVRGHTIWEASSLAEGTAWWLKAEEFLQAGKPAVISAAPTGDSDPRRRWALRTRNLKAFSVDSSCGELAGEKIQFLQVDGFYVPVRPGTGWTKLVREENGWRVVRPAYAPLTKSAQCEGPLWRVLARPFLLVTGSAVPERATLWRKAAEAFAEEWQRRTGLRPEIQMDSAVTPEMLDGRNLLLFGSPNDNLLTETLLENDAAFLRELFLEVPEESRAEESLSAVALHPAEVLSPGRLAAVVVANGNDAIAESWQPLVEELSVDYVIRSVPFKKSGCFQADWKIHQPL